MNEKLDGGGKAEGESKVDARLRYCVTKHIIRHSCKTEPTTCLDQA